MLLPCQSMCNQLGFWCGPGGGGLDGFRGSGIFRGIPTWFWGVLVGFWGVPGDFGVFRGFPGGSREFREVPGGIRGILWGFAGSGFYRHPLSLHKTVISLDSLHCPEIEKK